VELYVPRDECVDRPVGDEVLNLELLLHVRVDRKVDASVRPDPDIERRRRESAADPGLDVLDQRRGLSS